MLPLTTDVDQRLAADVEQMGLTGQLALVES